MSSTDCATLPLYGKEDVEWKGWDTLLGILIVILSLAAVLVYTRIGGVNILGMHIEPLAVVEMVAVFDTVVFGALYFLALFAEARKARFEHPERLLFVSICWVVSTIALCIALLSLFPISDPLLSIAGFHANRRPCYVVAIVVSFFLFALCDFVFAWLHKDIVTTRTYWTLFAFGDLPTVLAAGFFAFFLWLPPQGKISSEENAYSLVSGALVVQMLFADILVLTTTMNLHYRMLRWLIGNCDSQIRWSRGAPGSKEEGVSAIGDEQH